MRMDVSPLSLKRTAQQITSLFSRLTAALRHRGIEAEEIEAAEGCRIEAAESEMALDTLRSLVMDDMGRPTPPIIVGTSNICKFVKSNKPGSLKLATLKEICLQLDLATSGPLTRKKTVRPLKYLLRVVCAFRSNVTVNGLNRPRPYNIYGL